MRILIFFFFLSLSLLNGWSADDYWQQEVNYDISVELFPESKTAEGEITIEYTNNANTHLDTIWIHLWPNAYSKYNTALALQLLENDNLIMDIKERAELGGIDQLNFKVNNQNIEVKNVIQHPDIAALILNESLLPGEKIEITTPFVVKVPAPISRLGTEEGYFAMTQWYPKPAVFDKNGWHPMPYLDQGEFYGEFGNFKVEITVPNEYTVAATGKLTTEKVKNNNLKTLVFEQNNIHDFAWFASHDFKHIADEVTLDNGYKVAIHTYYLTDSKVWREAHLSTAKAIKMFSDIIGPYPYSHCTVVEGPLKAGGGMEYPMITIMEDDPDSSRFESVIAHEVAHNWWQGILASNERSEPWIDEGFACYYENRYNNEIATYQFKPETILTDRKVAKFFDVKDITYAKGEKLLILQQERLNQHQPSNLDAPDYTDYNYFLNFYAKAHHQITYLEKYLGREKFDDCIRSFYKAYQFKHIDLEVLQEHFENCADKDLGFFFDDWLTSNGIVNNKIGKITKQDNEIQVEVKRNEEIQLPVPVTAIYEDVEETKWLPIDDSTLTFNTEGLKEIIVDRENLTMDYNRSNNFYKTKGIGKLEKIRPQLFLSLENPKKTQIYFLPMIAGNTHDKFMLGLSIYNRIFPKKDFEWDITPLYAFGSNQLNGITNVSYTFNIRKDRKAQLTIANHFKTFSYNDASFGGRYINIRPSLTGRFAPKDDRKRITHVLKFTHHHSWRELIQRDENNDIVNETYQGLPVEELSYQFKKEDVKTPLMAFANIEFNNEHARAAAETNVKVRYGKIKSFFSARVWISGLIAKQNQFATSSQIGTNYRLNLTGDNGARDYLFEQYYLGRNENTGFISRQLTMNQGQFKFAQPNELASNILAASINIRLDAPTQWIPIKAYMDIGTIYNAPFGQEENELSLAFQFGFMISLLDEAFEVYFPLFSSSGIKDFYDLNTRKYRQRITFAFNLNKLNPQKYVERLSF